MADDIKFTVEIPNKDKMLDALSREPDIARPTFQKFIEKAQAILAKHTTRDTVPWKTGNLVQTFQPKFGDLMAMWFPTAAYRAFVEFGTAAHDIEPVNKKVLANRRTGQIFGRLVHHPGTKAQPYMERILESATPEINDLASQALAIVASDIAAEAGE